jgi:hypothetical protein
MKTLDTLVRAIGYRYWEDQDSHPAVKEVENYILFAIQDLLPQIKNINAALKDNGFEHFITLRAECPVIKEPKDPKHLTIREILEFLSTLDRTTMLPGWECPHSYRGYYECLAVEPSNKRMSAFELYTLFFDSVGSIFDGWKGGHFEMHENTLVYSSTYGVSNGIKMTKELLLGTS